ncbi:MAG: ABC transporter permease [Proteobacteria bacterium]|nr:ABC transporter permease [Pseudomonadota bacterium]MBU1741618.1 ABC transporter permease [Pseudomonadota bacterium]
MNLRRTVAVIKKETRHLLRDKRSLAQTVLLPMIMLFLFGYALSLDVDRIPTVIYDLDQTVESKDLLRRLGASRYFEIIGAVNGYKQLERMIMTRRAMMALVIPRGFGAKLKKGQRPKVQVFLDGVDASTATIGLGYIQGLVGAFGMERVFQNFRRMGLTHFDPPLDIRMRVWFNPELRSKNFIIPGLIAVIMAIVSASTVSLTIAREWENGTMEQLVSTPLRPLELVVGKMVPYVVLGMVSLVLSVVVAVYLFRVPFKGSVTLLLALSFLFLIGTSSMGLLISIRTKSQLVANQAGVVTTFLPSFLLSGFIFPILNMPVVLQYVTLIVPARYYVSILKGLFLKGIGLTTLAVEVGFLAGFAAVMFFLATRSLKMRLN